MKILIVDDEPLARSRLKTLISDLAAGDVVAEAGNGQQALTLCEQHVPDIVLLDIRMPGMDGIEAAHHLYKCENPPAVIFTTAYDEYALQAFDANAIDYLLKPIRKERLQEALNKAKRLTPAQDTALSEASEKQPSHISARVQGGLRLINVNDIYYFHAEHKYVTVYYKDGQVLIEEALKSLEEKFKESFIRIHRNALVARDQLKALERDSNGHFKLVLKGSDTKLDVSRRHLPSLRKIMKDMT
ncbi:MAG: LytTR family DNA-binding domain-containing protein [Gammaproteobacteria bacterium]|jgi:two-component system response regulator AlgR